MRRMKKRPFMYLSTWVSKLPYKFEAGQKAKE
jgi:hypothetical protein